MAAAEAADAERPGPAPGARAGASAGGDPPGPLPPICETRGSGGLGGAVSGGGGAADGASDTEVPEPPAAVAVAEAGDGGGSAAAAAPPPAPPSPGTAFHHGSPAHSPSPPPSRTSPPAFVPSPSRRLSTTATITAKSGHVTLVQLPPADVAASRAQLPPEYDSRCFLLGLRMVAAAAAFVLATAAAAAALVAAVGWRPLLLLAAAGEVAFLAYYPRLYRHLDQQPSGRHAPEKHDGLAAFNRLLQACRQFRHRIDPASYLSTWFCGADPRLIRRENIAELMAYGFWYTSSDQMRANGQGPLLESCVDALAETFNLVDLQPGRTPGLAAMHHLWEPLKASYRPLILYGITELVALLTRALLLAAGCRTWQDRASGMLVVASGLPGPGAAGAGAGQAPPSPPRLLRRMPTWVGARAGGTAGGHVASTTSPVVLLHGVGLGLLPYINLVRCLLAAGLPLLAVEYKHVAMRLCSVVPSADDISNAVVRLMGEQGVDQACLVAHSYGTFVASRLAQVHPKRLQSLALLDPGGAWAGPGPGLGRVRCASGEQPRVGPEDQGVQGSRGMFLPHLLSSFFYRPPRTTDLRSWIEDNLVAFISKDLHCAAAMCRRFYWSDLNLWPQDLPGRTLVALAGRDQLMDVEAVLDFVRSYASKVLFNPHHSHAQMLGDPGWQQQIVADISAMASAGGGAAGAQEVRRRLTHTIGSCPSVATSPSSGGGGSLAAALGGTLSTMHSRRWQPPPGMDLAEELVEAGSSGAVSAAVTAPVGGGGGGGGLPSTMEVDEVSDAGIEAFAALLRQQIGRPPSPAEVTGTAASAATEPAAEPAGPEVAEAPLGPTEPALPTAAAAAAAAAAALPYAPTIRRRRTATTPAMVTPPPPAGAAAAVETPSAADVAIAAGARASLPGAPGVPAMGSADDSSNRMSRGGSRGLGAFLSMRGRPPAAAAATAAAEPPPLPTATTVAPGFGGLGAEFAGVRRLMTIGTQPTPADLRALELFSAGLNRAVLLRDPSGPVGSPLGPAAGPGPTAVAGRGSASDGGAPAAGGGGGLPGVVKG
ncbi:hypothetical protein HYH03_014066 [Edaphochlamys debaryana]|uniref:AB hydrolase-1 domain-containing protein n=1 Tax=Edaphochlamys debaryana TaxID=47281 RepID=A0A835XNK7_9CHLO|nr:hypothetical protein HYH03_014066 [Edaphochlamys debaryana]|eukprot:KAG2487353.1 hypothetical protein HYH03_014066 [Edaphochlamys debaryana]